MVEQDDMVFYLCTGQLHNHTADVVYLFIDGALSRVIITYEEADEAFVEELKQLIRYEYPDAEEDTIAPERDGALPVAVFEPKNEAEGSITIEYQPEYAQVRITGSSPR